MYPPEAWHGNRNAFSISHDRSGWSSEIIESIETPAFTFLPIERQTMVCTNENIRSISLKCQPHIGHLFQTLRRKDLGMSDPARRPFHEDLHVWRSVDGLQTYEQRIAIQCQGPAEVPHACHPFTIGPITAIISRGIRTVIIRHWIPYEGL